MGMQPERATWDSYLPFEFTTAHNSRRTASLSPMRRLFQLPVLLFALSLTIASLAADAQTNFGSVAVGSSAASSVTVTIPSAVTLGSISVLTQGTAGLDFTNSGTGTCSSGTSYAAGQTCTVEVAFKPQYPGGRYGVVLLKDGSGNLIATSYLYGIGLGPADRIRPRDRDCYRPGSEWVRIESALGGGRRWCRQSVHRGRSQQARS